MELTYTGMKGTHLPNFGQNINTLPDQYLSLGSRLTQTVPNPLFGFISTGPLAQPTVTYEQLLRPYPQYQNVNDPAGYLGDSSFNSMQARLEKRFNGGGSLTGAYTFSKNMGDVESSTNWLDNAGTGGGNAGIQNYHNLRGDHSISSFDSRHRLVISYVYDLPIGKGKRLLGSAHGVADKLISGWGFNGITTIQKGFPIGITQTPNNTFSLGGGSRPNAVASCNKTIDGSIQARLSGYFNTACFTAAAPYTYGNESRTDPVLRGPGIANYDLSLFKRFVLTERIGIEFRAESFNLFNRVQFGGPNTALSTAANSTFGVISSQANQPRLIQFAARLKF